MSFIDPDTGLYITCTVEEYERLSKKYIKTKWTSYTQGGTINLAKEEA